MGIFVRRPQKTDQQGHVKPSARESGSGRPAMQDACFPVLPGELRRTHEEAG